MTKKKRTQRNSTSLCQIHLSDRIINIIARRKKEKKEKQIERQKRKTVEIVEILQVLD